MFGNRNVNKVILHCSANDSRVGTYQISVDDIYRYHTKTLKYTNIGYHFIVTFKGEIWLTRPLNQAGAHTYGYNQNSIGICYLGGCKGKQPFNSLTTYEDQKKSFLNLIDAICQAYKLDVEKDVILHNEVAQKACPSFDRKWYTQAMRENMTSNTIKNPQQAITWLKQNVHVYITNKNS